MKSASRERGNAFFCIVPQVCAIMVVVLHQYNTVGLGRNSIAAYFVSFISHGLCTAAVPTFFCMSGYLFWRKVDTFQDVWLKMKRRVKTVLLPFCLWNIFYALLFNVTQVGGGGNITVPQIISSVFFYKYYFPMWYMFQLMIFFLLSPLFYLLLKDFRITIAIIICCALISIFYKNSISIEIDGLNRPLVLFNYLVYYLAGALLSKYTCLITKLLNVSPRLHICIVLFVFLSLLSSLCMDEYIIICYSRILVPVVFLFFVILMAKLISFKKMPQNILYGVSPMAIYGMHGFAGTIASVVLDFLCWSNSLLRYFVLCISVVAMTIAICWLFKRFMPKTYNLFVGFR